MNQNLKNIIAIIQQSARLSDGEKNSITEAVNEAEKFLANTELKFANAEKKQKTAAGLVKQLKKELSQKSKIVAAHNRELEIEAALEKVRAITITMQYSGQLREVILTLTNQLQALNFNFDSANFSTQFDKEGFVVWNAAPGSPVLPEVYVPYKPNEFIDWLFEKKEKQIAFASHVFGKEEKNNFFNYYFSETSANQVPEEIKSQMLEAEQMVVSSAIRKNFVLSIFRYQLQVLSQEEREIFMRFANVFEQSYTRFLDMQKAEAQAREAQIELGLERVRARAMEMRSSGELKELIGIVFTELTKLDLLLTRCLIMIYDVGTNGSMWWMANSEAPSEPIGLFIKNHEHKPYLAYLDAWRQRRYKWQYILEGEDKKEWDDFLFVETELSHLPEFVIDGMKKPGRVYLNASFNSFGNLTLATLESLSDAHSDILLRFAKVFDLTYTRFNDLQKAEAQAREAQIEAAMERVRSRTMAMHRSQELLDVIHVVSEQLVQLNFRFDNVSLGINNSDYDIDFWMAAKGQPRPIKIHSPYIDNPLVNRLKEARQNGLEFFSDTCTQEENRAWIWHTIKSAGENIFSEQTKSYLLNSPGYSRSTVLMENINFFIGNYAARPFSSEENNIFKRFGNVIGQSYTRFLDLQKAEAQARESQIEAALERVRSRTLAMQKSDELREAAAVLFRQLILLGIAPNRLYIDHIKNANGDAEFWITDEDGSKVSSAFESNLNSNSTFKKMLDGWREKKKSLVLDLKGAELEDYLQHITNLQVTFKDGVPQTRRLHYLAYFNQGFIGLASSDEQPEETLILLERFAAVFNLTFARFSDLKVAEAHARQAEIDLLQLKNEKNRTEVALAELKETQRQLIQSEKMASLGELTAGIAHEIQNPLNFVNNFSELNDELLDELATAVKNNDSAAIAAVSNDIKSNLQKINHHGKRADAIVKGMLLHSRTSSGIKELTDINVLADEYLRLSYHGLRGKDKNFNAIIRTDFDDNIGKINIIPQDMGRVLLNLLTNAFYSVTDKKKNMPDGYEPTVSISTKKLEDSIELRVVDNGCGISQAILDKIFHPFFTTKPTGEGTGLGLSMSYDIVKTHDGEIKVSSVEGAGATFIIRIPLR